MTSEKPSEEDFDTAIDVLNDRLEHLKLKHSGARVEIQCVECALVSLMAWREEVL
jgi:hypothetical protein